MNIAVVGGGIRCRELIKIVKTHTFKKISPKIIGVSDINITAPGFVLARESGLFVTENYNDFFERDDIDLIIELTGNMDVYNDIIKKKKRTVGPLPVEPPSFFGKSHVFPTCKKRPRKNSRKRKNYTKRPSMNSFKKT